MPSTAVQQFLQHLSRDPLLQVKVQAAITADEVAMLAQELGYTVSGSDLLMLDGQHEAGVRVTRVDHPGEYPGRYY
ncbi:Nif11-like leader peptide family natural product precursor [Synechococcus sp. A15-24]|uniref:Nif11-like leader peptide family natural product precursor n=1 Tax=Synechococcus sp. A15-24 TaxID=1050635 RepID=UPI0016457090|nr:Nif11-like leader peptide family natural product precursor [Synechococcus sp. A15-24]